MILKSEKELVVWNILDLSQSKYAQGRTDSEVSLSTPCPRMSLRVIYDSGNIKLGVWNFWPFTNAEIVLDE